MKRNEISPTGSFNENITLKQYVQSQGKSKKNNPEDEISPYRMSHKVNIHMLDSAKIGNSGSVKINKVNKPRRGPASEEPALPSLSGNPRGQVSRQNSRQSRNAATEKPTILYMENKKILKMEKPLKSNLKIKKNIQLEKDRINSIL